MKYQPQNELIDPEERRRTLDFEFDEIKGNDDSDIPNDAYVIGADGNAIEDPADAGTGLEDEKPPNPWLKPAAVVLGVLFVGLTAWNVGQFAKGPYVPPKPTAFQSKQALYLGVMKIEAYRRVHGVVPDSLAEAGMGAADAYEFKRVTPTRYVLGFRNRGAKFEYDSIEPADRFFGSPGEVLKMGGSQ